MCERCEAVFTTDKDKKSHLRVTPPCEIKEPPQRSDARIDPDQEEQVRLRETKSSSQDERWRRVFAVIFPGEDIPSPCKHWVSVGV